VSTVFRIVVALVFIGLNLYIYRFFAREETIPLRESFATFPMVVDGWRCRNQFEIGKDELRKLGVTDYLLCDFVHDRSQSIVNVYTGYHESQTRNAAGGSETLIHPPEHCLPGAGWDIIESDIVALPVGLGGEAKRVVVAKGNLRNLVYFWYQSRGRMIARNHEKILYMFLDRAVNGRTDGSLVRFTVPIVHGDAESAEEAFRSVAQALTPLFPDYVPN